jgi:hypothetical protein
MDLMTLLENRSFTDVRLDSMIDRRGADVLVAIAKLTYEIDAKGEARLVSSPFRLEVETVEGEETFPSDFFDEKPGTDFGVVGRAIPPSGQTVQKMLTWIQVGGLRKVVQVFGPRVYTAGIGAALTPGPSAKLVPVRVRYGLAFGGTDRTGPEAVSSPENPVGLGFARDPKRLVGTLAHQLEAVAEPTRTTSQELAAFAPVPSSWELRRRYAGTYDDAWVRERLPVRPVDFDPRFNSWSHPELWHATPLSPDVPMEIGGMTPEGVLRFKLPAYAPRFFRETGGRDDELSTHLDSILIDTETRRAELSWRASAPLPRKWQAMGRVRVRGEGHMPPSVAP